ncbi:MAG: flagellar biosynthesis protein FlgE [Oleiphilaceae bacterium]|nr:flagellar biosynthesis protein FlgE [Oleiphilaceae bacterium]
MISNVLTSGLEGVRNGTNGMQDAASRIARAGTGLERPQTANPAMAPEQPAPATAREAGSGDLLEPIVDLKLSQRQAEASLVVVSSADEMLGTLLDVKA